MILAADIVAEDDTVVASRGQAVTTRLTAEIQGVRGSIPLVVLVYGGG